MKLLPGLALAAALILVACSGDGDSGGTMLPPVTGGNDTAITYLGAGNRWTSLVTQWNGGSNPLTDTIQRLCTLLVDSTPRKVFLQGTYAYIPFPVITLYGIRDDGVHVYGAYAPADTLMKEALFLKYPVAVGDYWPYYEYSYSSGSGFSVVDSLEMSCVSLDTSYTTPAGTFSCICYLRRSLSTRITNVYYYYFNMSVGMVAQEKYDGGMLQMSRVLTAYSVQL